jgi:hypothetical protein
MGARTINDLSSVVSISGGDQIAVWQTSNGDTRKASVSQWLEFFSDNFASPEFDVLINTPITGQNLVLATQTKNLWQILTPAATIATLTITLPPVAGLFDGQEVLVTTTQQVTALTVGGNGATVEGEPSSLGAGGFFALRYNLLLTTWFAISAASGSTSSFTNITITGDILDGQVILAFEPNTGGAPVDGNVVIKNGDGASAEISVEGTSDNVDLNITAKNEGNIRISTQGTGNIDLSPGGDDVASVDGDEIVTRTVVMTLTNKTLSLPILSKPSADAVVFAIGALALLQAVYPPAANPGLRAIINDSNATLAAGIGNAAADGGANIVPVFSDGANYIIG